MAKKKRRRPQQRPRPRPEGGSSAAAARATAEATEGSPSKRAERKEEARRERERRIRQAKRRQRTRKLIRWGIVVGIVAIGVGIWYVANRESRELQEAAAAAAERVNASTIEEQTETLPNEHQEPYAVGTGGVPSFGGNHTGGALRPEPKVYTQQPPEETAIHNLEHGYVLVYYSDEGDTALDPEIVSALDELVRGETEVLMSPYAGLDKPLYLVAWGARQSIEPPEDANPEDVLTVARAFIDEWKNGPYAPEAAAG